MPPRDDYSARLKATLHRNLIFVHGKGGVGKTTVSHAIAKALSQTGSTLWLTLEDPLRPLGTFQKISPTLSHLNADFTLAFEEYAALKIKMTPLTHLFLQNKLIRYLAKAAPGIHELVLLGKIWYERTRFQHIVIDLPSTGHGLAMFQSTENFIKLFHGGPLHRDAHAMLTTFKDPQQTGHLIVTLPEEMPLRESLELKDYLQNLSPENAPAYLINKRFPDSGQNPSHPSYNPQPNLWPSPIAHSAYEYATKRVLLEQYNLRIWREAELTWGELPHLPPTQNEELTEALKIQLLSKGFV